MAQIGAAPRKLLYVQASGGGGSVISLLLLVKHLDPDRYRPFVLFCQPSSYASEFTAMGAQVLYLDPRIDARPWIGPNQKSRNSNHRTRRTYRSIAPLIRLLKRDLPRALEVARIARDVGADLVHSNVSPSADRASIIGASMARCRHVCHVRFMQGPSRFLDMPLSHLVDRYVYISEAVSRQFRSDTGIGAHKGSVIYNPFEFGKPPARETARGLRRQLGVADGESLIANVGRLVPWKGQDVFLRAFANVVHHHPEARAIIVGGAKQTDAGRDFEARLHRLAEELNLGDRVIFTGHRPDVADVMAAADFVVHSSCEPEPFGRVVMEAIVLERPIIATAAGGVLEMVRSGVTGTLVPPGDSAAMAQAISGLLGNMSRANAMARRARAVSCTRFAAATHVKAIEAVYEQVLGPQC